jgi:hypothetical protein
MEPCGAVRFALMLLLATPLAAQDMLPGAPADTVTCDFDRCAMRMRHRYLGTTVVRGVQALPVARVGWFPPRIAALEAAGDSSRSHYQSFRSLHRRGAWLTVGAAAAFLGAVVLYQGSYLESDGGVGLFVGSLGLSFAGGLEMRRASDQLSQSIWWYNRDLPRAP